MFEMLDVIVLQVPVLEGDDVIGKHDLCDMIYSRVKDIEKDYFGQFAIILPSSQTKLPIHTIVVAPNMQDDQMARFLTGLHRFYMFTCPCLKYIGNPADNPNIIDCYWG